MEHVSLQTHDVIQTFIAENKTKLIKKTKTTDAPRKTHSA
jgi:hypothetical protein